MFPVHVYDGGRLPDEGTHFVVAGNGIWLHKDTDVASGYVQVPAISFLPDLPDAGLRVKLPKVPAKHVWRIKEFFSRVVAEFNSEAETTLYYNRETGDFKVLVPKQTVSYGGVRYERSGTSHLKDMAGYLCVGTIHSHCTFNAFHSGVDDADEDGFDGLHVTFGHNDKAEFSISASVVLNGNRFKIAPDACLEGVEPVGDRFRLKPPETGWEDGLADWMSAVSRESFFSRDTNPFEIGDSVELLCGGGSGLLDSLGRGPFTVVAASKEMITIGTKAGPFSMSNKLFRKAAAGNCDDRK